MKFLVLTCKNHSMQFCDDIFYLQFCTGKGRNTSVPPSCQLRENFLITRYFRWFVNEFIDRLKYVIFKLSSYRYLLCVIFPALRHRNINILLRSVKIFDSRSAGKYLNYPRGPSKLQENLISKSSMSTFCSIFSGVYFVNLLLLTSYRIVYWLID